MDCEEYLRTIDLMAKTIRATGGTISGEDVATVKEAFGAFLAEFPDLWESSEFPSPGGYITRWRAAQEAFERRHPDWAGAIERWTTAVNGMDKQRLAELAAENSGPQQTGSIQ